AITAIAVLLAGRKTKRIYAIIKRDIAIVLWSIVCVILSGRKFYASKFAGGITSSILSLIAR
ncbi:MAG: hypothetical protein WC454_08635, partial [Phycisphaerae bacterium]